MFKYDGKTYDINVKSLTRSFSKLSTDESGRIQAGSMRIFLIGTFYNYTLTFTAGDNDQNELGRFWEDISAPKDFAPVSFPYNQTYYTFSAYVTQGEQPLIRRDPATGKNYWGELTITFTAEAPARRP